MLSVVTNEEVEEIINNLRLEQLRIQKQVSSLVFYMGGGITREEAWAMPFEEREEYVNLINKSAKR